MFSGDPLVFPCTKPAILPSIDPLPYPIIPPSKGSTYFFVGQPNSTSTSNLRRDTSIFTTVKYTMEPSNVTSSVYIFDTSRILKSPSSTFPYDLLPDIPRPRP